MQYFFISNICAKYGMGLWFGLVVIHIILVDNYNQLCSTTNDFFTVHVVLVISS